MEQPKNNKLIFIIPLIVAVVSMILLFLGLINGWFGTPSGVAKEFCEGTHPGLIKQPYNTWSNIGFIISGLCIGWLLMTLTLPFTRVSRTMMKPAASLR